MTNNYLDQDDFIASLSQTQLPHTVDILTNTLLNRYLISPADPYFGGFSRMMMVG